MATKKVKLNKIARAWVTALRSGKFKKTTCNLGRVDKKTGELVGNCVFGVLCELAVKNKIISSATNNGLITYDGNFATPPEAVGKWIGLKNRWGQFGSDPRKNLVELNDATKKSFKQIARIIEQKATELFV